MNVAGRPSVVLQTATRTDGPLSVTSHLLVRLKLAKTQFNVATKRVYYLFSVVKCSREVVQPL